MNAKRVLLGACVAMALPLSAQAGPFDGFMVGIFDTDSGFDLRTTGIVFSNTLHTGYENLSASRTSSIDYHDGELFNHKARTAARRSVVPPDEISDRELDDGEITELSAARIRLRRAYLRGAKEVAPVDSALAQVAFDCWIEAAEGNRDDDAAACRDEFNNRMARVEDLANYGLRQAALAPPEAAPVEPKGPYIVYFQWDSTVVTQGGRDNLDRAIAEALANPGTQIKLVGHADRSGALGYNQALSERRSRLVVQEMEAAGVDVSSVAYDSVGETMPMVPTPDGQREPRNRVVEVNLF